MRNKRAGLIVSTLVVAALGALTAVPALATTYIVKNLQSTTQGFADGCDTGLAPGTNHGTVVFKRTASTMQATVHLRGGAPNTAYRFRMLASTSAAASGPNSVCGSHDAYTTDLTKSTDGSGNADINLGPAPFFGNPYHDFNAPGTYTCGTGTGQDPNCVQLQSFWVYTGPAIGGPPAFRTVRVTAH